MGVVRLEVEEGIGEGRPEGSPSLGEVVPECVVGTNDDPLFFTMCVNSSFASAVPGALAERFSGSVSWSGLRKDVSRKLGEDFGGTSGGGVDGGWSIERGRVADRPAVVVSTTVGECRPDGTERYVLTASRICSSANGRSWK